MRLLCILRRFTDLTYCYAQVAASLSSSLNPAGEARPVLPGPGQTLNLASTFAAAAAKATAVQPDLAPQVPACACVALPLQTLVLWQWNSARKNYHVYVMSQMHV